MRNRKKIRSHLFEIVLVLVVFAVISMANGLSESEVDREISEGIARAEGGQGIVTVLNMDDLWQFGR